MTSYFYLEATKNEQNANFINTIESFADENKILIYVLDRPLTDQKYDYPYKNSLILLIPNHKISIINFGDNENDFEDFVEDVIEDIGSISDKYLYKEVLGRPRKWRDQLIETEINHSNIENVDLLLDTIKLEDEISFKKIELLISLFIGSINDIDRVKEIVPQTTLDKVKQKIQLFDGDQTRFIYQKPNKKEIRIQGLSGTGKTELLLHKLKDLYVNDITSKIYFTCHNKILADNLKKRIPSFFNFMKVEQQIEWEKRLWCTNAWGSAAFPNSGAYRYICDFYQIPFYKYSYQMSFSKACKLALDELKELKKNKSFHHAFTYMFIDESQDFDINFFELCDIVTEKNVYIAGDVFQNIFDEHISSAIEPDYLLGKCYRTDPKTLMFAHGLGMGLFESNKLRWLETKEWEDCGYQVEINENKYHLSREPLRRFEDVEDDFKSIDIVEINDSYSDTVINLLEQIKKENKTLEPDDVGIILLDSSNDIYELANTIQYKIQTKIGWNVYKAYETKEKINNAVLISNRNNVKGLEFPFVICITKKINNSSSYRNSLYTMLTRSFIKSFFLIPNTKNSGLTQGMKDGLNDILTKKQMIIEEPSEQEKARIRTRFKTRLKNMSHYDIMLKIFEDLKVNKKHHNKILQATQQFDMIESDYETLKEFVNDNLKYIKE